MVCQPVRNALLLGAIIAVAVSPARAQSPAAPPVPPPTAPVPPATAPCGPTTRTIQVMECVPETYTKKVVTYKRVCKTEEYDTCKWQCTQECRERVCCVTKCVPCMQTVTKKVCKTITVNEKRVVMKNCYKNVEECVQQKRLVELGHWECRERQPLLGNMFHNNNNCCDPCNPCQNNCCPRTVTHRVWVCCPKYECCPVKVCKRVCYQQPVEVCVPVCKRVEELVTCQVCTNKIVRENVVQKYYVPVMHKVPCKATRTVTCCVPVETMVTCTRMVPRCVTREVPCNPCDTCCCPSGGRFGGLFRTNGCCNR